MYRGPRRAGDSLCVWGFPFKEAGDGVRGAVAPRLGVTASFCAIPIHALCTPVSCLLMRTRREAGWCVRGIRLCRRAPGPLGTTGLFRSWASSVLPRPLNSYPTAPRCTTWVGSALCISPLETRGETEQVRRRESSLRGGNRVWSIVFWIPFPHHGGAVAPAQVTHTLREVVCAPRLFGFSLTFFLASELLQKQKKTSLFFGRSRYSRLPLSSRVRGVPFLRGEQEGV